MFIPQIGPFHCAAVILSLLQNIQRVAVNCPLDCYHSSKPQIKPLWCLDYHKPFLTSNKLYALNPTSLPWVLAHTGRFRNSIESPCIFQHFSCAGTAHSYSMTDCDLYSSWALKHCALTSVSSKYLDKAVAVVEFTLKGILYLMDDFLSQVWQLQTTPKAWWGHAGDGTDNIHTTRSAFGCTPRTHCECFSKSVLWKLWCKISPTQLTESKNPRCCQLFLYFSTLFHIYTKIGQLIIWPEGWKNIPHRGGGGKCLSER